MHFIKIIQSSVKLKIGTTVGLIVFFALSASSIYFMTNSYKENKRNATNKIKILAEKNAASISREIDATIDVLHKHAAYFKFMRRFPNDNRMALTRFLKSDVEANPNYLGVTVTFEPGKFDAFDKDYRNKLGFYNDGRMTIYWYKENNIVTEWTENPDFDLEVENGNADWFMVPKETRSIFMYMDNYPISVEENKYMLMLTLSLPILDQNEFLGIVCYDYKVDFMQDIALKAKSDLFDSHGDVFVIDPKGVFAASTLSDTMIYKSVDLYNANRIRKHADFINKGQDYFEIDQDTLYYSYPIKFKENNQYWHLMLSVPNKIVHKEANAELFRYILIAFFIVIMSIVIMMFFVSRLIKPLKDLSKMAEEIADGNLEVEIKEVQNDDEIGNLAVSFDKMSKKLKEMAKGMSQRAESIAKRSVELSASSANIAQGVNRQSTSVEEVSASMEEMLAAVLSNADRAKQTELIAVETEQRILASQKVSEEAILALKQIAQNVEIITEIASKTDILAINASIEASRAGNSGSGFAVVAAEIRKLAENTQKAAQKITQLADTSLKISEEAGAKLTEIVPKVSETAAFVREIALASNEQNLTTQEINNALLELTNLSASYSEAADNLDNNSKELSKQAKWLRETIAFFRFKA